MKRTLGFLAIATALFSLPVEARTVLQNDSLEPGGQIAFYPDMNGGESFFSVFEVPDTHPDYQICRLFVWIGPGGFNIFSIRIGEAGEDGDETNLIWQTDLDAYQIFGSREQLSSIDLANQRIRTQARRIVVRFRHVEGQDAPPGIASDADGITPGRNKLEVFRRNGRWFRDFTENLEEDGAPPRPPGDWILRAEIVRVDEACPGGEDPLPDPDPPGPVEDAGMSPEPDAHTPLVEDAGVMDASLSDSRPPEPPIPDAGTPPGLDQGRPSDSPLELNRVAPAEGTTDRNTEVVINGRGFPRQGDVFAELGETRLLELDVLSASTLTAIVPAGMAAGTHDLRLTLGDGRVAILPNAFTVVGDSLLLTGVSPASIPQNTPSDISVQGQGFTADTRFTIAGVQVEDVALESPQTVRGTFLPSMPPGVYDVVARDGDQVARLERGMEISGPAMDAGPNAGVPSGDDGCMTMFSKSGAPQPVWVCLALMFGAYRRRMR